MQLLLPHLRAQTRNVSLNPRPGWLQLGELFNEEGQAVRPWPGFRIDSSVAWKPVTNDMWQEIGRKVAATVQLDLAEEWLLDAEAFLDAGNYATAVLTAAVAIEIDTNALIARELVKSRRISKDRAHAGIESAKLRELLLAYFDQADVSVIEQVAKTTTARNHIVHGRQRQSVTLEEAQTAIAAGWHVRERVRARTSA